MQVVRDARTHGPVPLWRQPHWTERFPWLVQGTTGRGSEPSFDLGLFGNQPVGPAITRWRTLRETLGFAQAIHARQAHRADVLAHECVSPGLLVVERVDGHVTRTPDILLAVSIADCVPVFLVEPGVRAVAVLHAGWRGAAGGMLEAGVRALHELTGARAEKLYVHFGPAICGRCYEVGPEVHEALGQPIPARNTPIDLRAILAGRAADLGVPGANISVSECCTKCDNTDFFSHRAGDTGRQMGVIGILP